MTMQEIKVELGKSTLDDNTKENIIEKILSNSFYKESYKILSSKEVEILYLLFNDRIGKDETTDTRLFSKMKHLVKAHPKQSVVVQTKIVDSMEYYDYPENFSSKIHDLAEMTEAWTYWKVISLSNLALWILSTSKDYSYNTSDEYGGSFYNILRLLVVLVDDGFTQEALEEDLNQYYEDSPKNGFLYRKPIDIFYNNLRAYSFAKLYDKVIEEFELKKDLLINESNTTIYRFKLYLSAAYGGVGDEQKMLEICQEMKEINPNANGVYIHLVEYYEEKDNLDMCAIQLENLYKVLPKPYYLKLIINFFLEHQMHQNILKFLNQPLDFDESQIEEWKEDAKKSLNN